MVAREAADTRRTDPIGVRRISLEAPWTWLATAWRQMWRAPVFSLGYGLVFALISAGLFALLAVFEILPIVLPLIGGFLLLGPLLAVGLYELARRLSAEEPIRARAVILVRTAAPKQIAFMGALLLIAYLAWIRIAFLLVMLFIGIGEDLPPLDTFFTQLFFTWDGVGLLATGTVIGGVIAFVIFAVTAVSIPMLMDRDMDAITAALTSIKAVRANLAPMLVWGWLILLLIAFGVATAFVGLIVTFPLVGMATWHAYQSLIGDGEGQEAAAPRTS